MVRTQIIVPCYNESGRLPVAAFDAYLAASTEVGFVLVNDGSTDETLGVLRSLEQRWPGRVTVVDQQPNQGKAEAVRVGVLSAIDAQAGYVGYFDADLATPLDEIAEFVQILDETPGVDIVVGARVALLGRHIERRASRHYLGRLFATAASMALGLPIYDTQCGAKLFRATTSVRGLFEHPFGSRWIFDVELLARYLAGVGSKDRLYELPLRRWTDVGESRVKARDFLRAGGEMAAIYRTYRLRRDLDLLLRVLSAPFLRYVGAGGIGTAVHYLVLTLVVELIGLQPAVATVIGAFAGATVNYILNYHFTFASKAPHSRTLPPFFAIAAASAALSGAGMWYAVKRLHLHYLIAQVMCTGVVLLVGYVLNKLWTFRSSPVAGGAAPVTNSPSQAPASERSVLPAVEGPKP